VRKREKKDKLKSIVAMRQQWTLGGRPIRVTKEKEKKKN
jgi:hypothetical protein